ncbi:helix-turn-helix domain-containing protein [Streptomyces youssoufiensis]
MAETSHTLGERVRDLRKRRGLSQQVLARTAGLSHSTVRKLEQSTGGVTRMETARALALALRVTTTYLLRRDPEDADPHVVDHWAPVRDALFAPPPTDYVEDDAPTPAGVRAALRAAEPLFAGDRFADLAVILPSLLRDADALDNSDREARAVRCRLLQLTGWLLTQTRQYEAAEHALTQATAASADRLDGSASVNTMAWLLLRTGQLSEARELAVRWGDDMEPRLSRATSDELSAWGWMMLRVTAAAVRDARPDEAADALRMAHAAAAALGREHAPRADFLRTFGPVTVALKRAENAAVAGKPDVVLGLASKIPSGGLRPTSNNRNRHLLDVADAHARLRRYDQAMEVLYGIQNASPEWLPQQRYAQDIVARVIRKRRTLTSDMRRLADAIGVPL